MSLSMEEMYISANIKNMLEKMELCKHVLLGKTDFHPRSKKDLMMVVKRSAQARQLEREEQMNMYCIPPVKGKKKHCHKTRRVTQKKRSEEEAEEEEEEEEEDNEGREEEEEEEDEEE